MLNNATTMKLDDFYDPFQCKRGVPTDGETFSALLSIEPEDAEIWLEFAKRNAMPFVISNAIHAILDGVRC